MDEKNNTKTTEKPTEKSVKTLSYSRKGGFKTGRVTSRTKERSIGKKTLDLLEKAGKTSQKKIARQLRRAPGFKNLIPILLAPRVTNVQKNKKVFPPETGPVPQKNGSKINTIKALLLGHKLQKSAKDYQWEWIGRKLFEAESKKGYNPRKLLENLKGLRILKTSVLNKQKDTATPISAQPSADKGGNPQEMVSEHTPPDIIPKNIPSRIVPRPSINRRLGQRFGNGRTVGKTLSSAKNQSASAVRNGANRILGNAVKEVGQKAVIWVAGSSMGFFLFLLIAIVIIVLFASNSSTGSALEGNNPPPAGGQPPANSNPIPGFTLSKSVSATQLESAQQITYTISYTNTGKTPAESITVFDTIPADTTLVQGSITGSYEIDSAQNIISWSLAKPENSALSSFSFSVLPQYSGGFLEISNYAWAESNSGGSTASGSDCSGFYLLSNPKGNFGDPNCDFANNNAKAKSDLYALLKQLDPENADLWFLKVIPCESSYNPNSYNPDSESKKGAYGLYQTNPNENNTDLFRRYDVGDVVWTEQTNNAVNLLKVRGRGYWGCF